MINVIASILLVAFLAGCASHPPVPVESRNTAVPQAGPAEAEKPLALVPVEVPPGYYLVKRGDNLLRISLDHGQYYKDVAAWNNLEDPNKISAGQLLRVVPPEGAAVVKPVAAPVVMAAATPVEALKREPKGGVVPYSDEAYARARGDAAKPEGKVVETPPKPLETAKSVDRPPPPVAPPPAAAESLVWVWPYGGKMLGGFSDSGAEGSSKGIDLSGKTGDPVLAAAGGKVVYSGTGLRGYGNLVIVKHDATFLSAYAHNSRILVKEGDAVTRGQKIAELGSSDADQPKLHFEIRRLGKPVDPLSYLPKR